MTRLFKNPSLFFLLLFVISCSHLTMNRLPATSQPFDPVEPGNVFVSYEPLQIELEAPLGELFSKKKMGLVEFKKSTVDGHLSYVNEQNQKITLPVSIHVKGYSSTDFCTFPKLEIKFKSKERAGTLFASTKTIDMNTHCAPDKSQNMPEAMVKGFTFNHREALLYRMAEVLGIPTFKARPVFVTYRQTQIPSVDQSASPFRAFFLEDMSAFTKRLHGREIKGTDDPGKAMTVALEPDKISMFAFRDVESSPQIDHEDAARIGLFQGMIANTDWFIKLNPSDKRFEGGGDRSNLWNTKIIELPTGKWVLFPQDFNFSGILFGTRSTANKKVIESVDTATQARLKQDFLDKKIEIYKLLETLTSDPEGAAAMKQTLDSFYNQL